MLFAEVEYYGKGEEDQLTVGQKVVHLHLNAKYVLST